LTPRLGPLPRKMRNKTQLETGSAVSVVNNVELLLKGLETRLNQSNITLGESINKKLQNDITIMQQHTKTVQDNVVASVDQIINTESVKSMQKPNAIHCMQILSDPSADL
jgi:hypothetical protein